jgi:hypothetical protein
MAARRSSLNIPAVLSLVFMNSDGPPKTILIRLHM